jgi:gamma-glutamyltranspeptidase/glutathione hydrolase
VARRGGILRADDLAAYRVVERAPLEASRFGRRWVTAPPPSAGGFTMLESLALLERWLPRPREGARFRHALAESWKGGFRDRALYAGDPDHVTVPVSMLLDDARLARRAAVFHRYETRPMADYDVSEDEVQRIPSVARDHGTSHVCVVDAEGNVASLTTTVNLPFGARFTVEGMVMNDQMDDFAREVGAANAFGLPGGSPNLPGPGRRPVSTMSPTIVFDGALPVLCVGGSGGSRIVTAVEQVALFQLLLGDDAGAAVRRPRVHHQGEPATLSHEHALDPRIALGLAARGHTLAPVEVSANVQTIRIHRDGAGAITALDAASDLRKDGAPAGE